MGYTVTINSSGQATIPKAVREAIGVGVGDQLTYEIDADGRVLLRKEPSRQERLSEMLRQMDLLRQQEDQRNPRFATLRQRYAGFTPAQIDELHLQTPAGKAAFEERYGVSL